jgi:hypothetical protein
MTIVVSNNITNVQASDSAAARADRLLAEAAAAKATGVVPTTTGVIRANSIAALAHKHARRQSSSDCKRLL